MVSESKNAVEERNVKVFKKKFGKDLDDYEVWTTKYYAGYACIPRWLSVVASIMDKLITGKPLSNTYLALWFRVDSNGYVQIKNEQRLAFESGFDSSRKISSWKTRMRLLEKLGFIVSRKGQESEFQYVVILDPFFVVMKLLDANKASETNEAEKENAIKICIKQEHVDLMEEYRRELKGDKKKEKLKPSKQTTSKNK